MIYDGNKTTITCIGICKEEKCCESAEEVTKWPVIVADVVRNSARQRQGEQGVRQCQVDQIDGGGVELLFPLADNKQHQAVAARADEENHRVENRKEDNCSSLVDKHIAAALVWRDFS